MIVLSPRASCKRPANGRTSSNATESTTKQTVVRCPSPPCGAYKLRYVITEANPAPATSITEATGITVGSRSVRSTRPTARRCRRVVVGGVAGGPTGTDVAGRPTGADVAGRPTGADVAGGSEEADVAGGPGAWDVAGGRSGRCGVGRRRKRASTRANAAEPVKRPNKAMGPGPFSTGSAASGPSAPAITPLIPK